MEEEYTLDLREFCGILKKRLKMILFVTMASAVVTGILSFLVIPPTYEGRTSIIIGKAPGQHNTNTMNQYGSNDSDIYMYQKLIKTYASIAKSDLVLDKTAKLIGQGMTGMDIQKVTTVTPEIDTQILEIKCQSRDAEMAQTMTNMLAVVFIEASQKIYPTDNINIMDSAKLPDKPVKPKKILNIAIAFLIGLMGSIAIALMLEYIDNTIKNEEDVDKFLQLPVLGVIPLNMKKA